MKYNPFQPNQIVAPGMFVGRGAEVRIIERNVFQAKHGNPQHFLIEGERGIGKSSLLVLVSSIATDGAVTEDQDLRFIVLSVDLAGVTSQHII